MSLCTGSRSFEVWRLSQQDSNTGINTRVNTLEDYYTQGRFCVVLTTKIRVVAGAVVTPATQHT